MKFEFKDNLTNYLDELQRNVSNSASKERTLKQMGTELAEMVTEVVPKWNPNLMYSGLNEAFWKLKHDGTRSSLSILYTGFTGDGGGEPDDIQVWWEFGKYHKGGYSDILGRDYAYYQEFGVDKFAPNSKVKAPGFSGHHYLESGIHDLEDGSENSISKYYAAEFLRNVLNIK